MTTKLFVAKVKGRIGKTIFNLYDLFLDYQICGCSLVKFVPTLWRESKGSTASGSTHYHMLKVVFEHEDFRADDNLIDIGCGKGRVLAYLISAGFKGSLTGIEHNQEVASYGQKWLRRKHYSNATILAGDAFALDYNQFSIISMARPFMPWAFKRFIEKLEAELTHPVKLYYLFDQESGSLLHTRPGWTRIKHGVVFYKFGLRLHYSPQGYSVWLYNPAEVV